MTDTTAEKTKVLLIEDDRVDRMAFERLIRQQQLDYEYSMAESLTAARRLLDSESFDVIISDYRLPDGTATQLFDWQLEAPVIVTTGAGCEEIAVQAMRAGAYNYLIKDLERNYLKVLPITVENALRKHRADRQLRMLSHAFTSINEAVFISDMGGRLIYVNQAFCHTYGYSQEELLGSHRDELWHEESLQKEYGDDTGSGVRAAPSSNGGSPAGKGVGRVQVECLHKHRDGRPIPVLLSRSRLVDSRGQAIAEVHVAWDISQRKRAEDALRESEERYALAAQGANDGLWDWNLKTGEVYFSARWQAMTGYESGEIGNSLEDWFRLVHPEDLPLLRAQLEAHLSGHTAHFENEHRLRHKEGTFRWVLSRGLAVRQESGQAYRMAGSQSDITERKAAEQRLLHDALHDALTGLPNRALFLERLGSAVQRLRRKREYVFAVLFLDLDRFKVINDSLGHLVGDQLLTAVARRLEACLRDGDMVARLGGDEFAILLDDLDTANDVGVVASRIQEELRRPFRLGGHEVFSDVSIGVTIGSSRAEGSVEDGDEVVVTSYERPEDMLRDADTAMYRAKAQATRRPVVFDPAMHADVMGLLRLENDLRRAVDRREFEVFFQPIVSLVSGHLRGFEALVRWRHPERGLVYPMEFLPVAEETGLIHPIGQWVLRAACRQARQWHDQYPHLPPVSVSVNVAAQQLSGGSFIEQVDEVLLETGLNPEQLNLEITEGVIMESPEVVTHLLRQLRDRRVKVQIDDFGTGYSSLSYLHHFPLDSLKIDQSFIRNMTAGGEDNREIVRTIVTLAHNLRMEVMAEGIETEEQLADLRIMECEYGQGYFFARPLEAAAAEELLVSARTWLYTPVGEVNASLSESTSLS